MEINMEERILNGWEKKRKKDRNIYTKTEGGKRKEIKRLTKRKENYITNKNEVGM